jgi:Ni/Co efflux regulator RcnB
MKKLLIAVAAISTGLAPVLASSSAAAQPGYYYDRYRDSDRDGRPDYREWNRDRDRDGRPDQYDRYDNRRGAYYGGHRYYGGRYGYSGYDGRWRTGQRFPYYRNDRYVIYDYRSYDLPPPRAGYRYYRDDNGDVVMAAIASGVIGLIIGGALSDNDHRYRRY